MSDENLLHDVITHYGSQAVIRAAMGQRSEAHPDHPIHREERPLVTYVLVWSEQAHPSDIRAIHGPFASANEAEDHRQQILGEMGTKYTAIVHRCLADS